MAMYQSNIVDEELLEIERRRGDALKRAIAAAMPEVPAGKDAAVLLFSAHLTGTLMAWQASDEPDGRKFMSDRTKDWLRMVRIPFADDQEEISLDQVAGDAVFCRATTSAGLLQG